MLIADSGMSGGTLIQTSPAIYFIDGLYYRLDSRVSSVGTSVHCSAEAHKLRDPLLIDMTRSWLQRIETKNGSMQYST